jgi:hypothetical protein
VGGSQEGQRVKTSSSYTFNQRLRPEIEIGSGRGTENKEVDPKGRNNVTRQVVAIPPSAEGAHQHQRGV